jgi:hypothetical protein
MRAPSLPLAATQYELGATVIHTLTEGQVHGGVVQGTGQVFRKRVEYKTADEHRRGMDGIGCHQSRT